MKSPPSPPVSAAASAPDRNVRRYLLLAAQILMAAGVLMATGRFAPVEVPDTASYADFPLGSFNAALRDYRTPGYPLFLSVLRPLSANWAIIPYAQFAVYCAAVVLLFEALRPSRGRCWIAGSLLASNILFGYVNWLSTETLAAALGIAAAALTLRRTSGNGRRTAWGTIALGLVVAAAWLVRPACLFLTGWVPLAGAMLAASRRHSANVGWRRELLVLTLATGLPVFAYCGMRWACVGRFGIVSFGGYNLIGLAGQLLEEPDLERLPEDLRPIASTGLELRRNIVDSRPDLAEVDRLNYDRMEYRYDNTIWRVFTPAAKSHYGNDHARLNTQLRRLAIETIRIRPRDYVVWLAKATRQGIRKLISDFVLNPVYLGLALLGVFLQGMVTVRAASIPIAERGYGPTTAAIAFLVAVSFATANLALVIIVCPPLGRMTDAAAVLLSMPLTAFVCERWRLLRSQAFW